MPNLPLLLPGAPWRRFVGAVILVVLVALRGAPLSAQETAKRSFNLPADAAATALKQFSQQSGRALIVDGDLVRGIKTNAVQGEFTVEEAVARLLEGTGLVAAKDAQSGAYTVKREGLSPNARRAIAQTEKSDRPEKDDPRYETDANGEKILKLDTFEVFGKKTLNMDIPRSRDDAQPYVVFDREQIMDSGAVNVGDFLKQRLSMNTQSSTPSQRVGTIFGNASEINLRGLGTNQTLILLDGHRVSGSTPDSRGPGQPDVNVIPLAAIERIEILPTTASGIYGGSATGGVVNVVLRRNFSGVEVRINYENTFEGDAPVRSAEIGAGFTLEDGKTNVLLSASWSDDAGLTFQDRDFTVRGRQVLLANNPGVYLTTATPIMGATANIRSATGTNLTLKSTGASLNSPITFVPPGYAGAPSDGGAALVANAGRFNINLASNANLAPGGQMSLINPGRKNSFGVTVRRQFSGQFQAFVDAMVTNNWSTAVQNVLSGVYTIPSASPTNPFNQNITVRVPIREGNLDVSTHLETQRLVGGFIVSLPGEWKLEGGYTWSRARHAYAYGPSSLLGTETALITTGSLDILRDPTPSFAPFLSTVATDIQPGVTTTFGDATVRTTGPLLQLPAGPITAALMVERQDGRIDDIFETIRGTVFYTPWRSQDVSSAYAEAKIPLVSKANARPGLAELELQLAGRYDKYSIDSSNASITSPTTPVIRATTARSSSNPTLGVKYRPASFVLLRASYGTGYLPPALSQIVATSSVLANATDPKRGNETILNATLLSGGDPSLRPEKSESIAFGAVITVPAIPSLRLSVDYTRIKKRDNIVFLGTVATLNNEAILPARVVRGPVPAGDPFGVGRITQLDGRAMNIATTDVTAYDVQLDYSLRTELGTFTVFGVATWQTHYKTQLISSVPAVENIGVGGASGAVVGFPLRFKANASLGWKRGPWSATWNTRYFDDYWHIDPRVPANAANITTIGNGGVIPRQVYHDLHVGYRWQRSGASALARVLHDTEIRVGVKNLFTAHPPVIPIAATLPYSPFGDPRLSTYVISVRRGF